MKRGYVFGIGDRLSNAGRGSVWGLVHLLLAILVMVPFTTTCKAAAWITWPGTSVAVPQDDFRLVGQGSFSPGATGGLDVSEAMISGDKWITLGKETVGTLGLTNQQISSAMQKFPKNTAYVFAQYSPENASGRITVQKVEKTPSGQVRVWQADFTPWSGELWKAQGKYRNTDEIAAGSLGYNPFAAFSGTRGDPVFHGMDWQAMMVAVGHAMRRYGAAFGFVAVDQPNVIQQTSSSSGWFTSSVTTTISGYVKPVWFVATPMEASPTGQTGQICVTGGAGVSTSSCDDPAHVATAGVLFSQWSGGNMPQTQDLIYRYVNTQSGWSILAFTMLFVIVTMGFATLLTPELLATEGALSVGEAGAEAYLGLNAIANGSGNLQQAQNGLFGTTGNGWLRSEASAANGPFEPVFLNRIEQRHVDIPMGSDNSLTGANMLYLGNCGAGFTVGQCRSMGLDPGSMWRPDSYAEYNSTKAMRQRYRSCTAPVEQGGLGLSGAAAEQCAAPAGQVIGGTP